MTDDSKYFVLFACCIPVRGARRSVICDLQRNSFKFIPNGLCDILRDKNRQPISRLKADHDPDSAKIIDEYFEFLVDNDFGFWTDDPNSFPLLDLSWKNPGPITNAVIDVDLGSEHDYNKVFEDLDALGCRAMELRIFRSSSIAELRKIISEAHLSRLRSIEILAGWSQELAPEAIGQLASEHPRVQGIVIHSAPESSRVILYNNVLLLYRKDIITSARSCGQVHPGYFSVNTETFAEATSYNSCLNRKISIDVNGLIKNCPSMTTSFGQFPGTSLREVASRESFAKLWAVSKDQVKVCRDCEFRYICTDCRAFIADPEDIYSKPAKCTYDPYTAQWKAEEILTGHQRLPVI